MNGVFIFNIRWNDALESFRIMLRFTDELDIKETIMIKLIVKKADILIHLGKANHADDALMDAQQRVFVF